MILRKPYALFIKYFKLLHVLIASFALLLLYRSYVIYNFFKNYSIDYRSVMSSFTPNDYLNTTHFVFITVVVLLTVVLLTVTIYKQKPKKIYIFNLLLYISLLIFYVFCNNIFGEARNAILDIKVSKAFRDLSLIAILLQFVSFIFMILRATGFDIKQFDFGSDLQKMDISSKDSEEIEVSLEFDEDEVRRTIRRGIRYLKYFYFEHKFIVNITLVCCFAFCFLFVYFRVRSYSERYSIGKTFDLGNVSLSVQDSFLLDTNSLGNKITTDNDTALVVVRINAKAYGNKIKLNKGMITLKIGDLLYNQSDYAKDLSDFGVAYTNQTLSDDYTTYIFTFAVSKSQALKKMDIKVNDVNSFVGGKMGAKNIYVRLKNDDLRKSSDTIFSKKLSEKIDFSDSILGKSNLIINNYELSDRFGLTYDFCYGKDKCIQSYEYLTPIATGNYYKTLIRLSGNLVLDDSLNISNIYDINSFFNEFGYVIYKIDNETYLKKISSEIIKPKVAFSRDYYIEIPFEVKNASELSLDFKIYNKEYKYVLK